MKRLFLLMTTICLLSGINAQTCLPDTTLADTIVISPFPYDAEMSPDGGLKDTACVGLQYAYTMTVNVPDTFQTALGDAPLIHVAFATQGAITYDPPLPNFTYVCNPPDCVFPGGETGCVEIQGIAVESEIGSHLALFTGVVVVESILGPLTVDIMFPDPNSPIVPPGEYDLVVRDPATFDNCDGVVGTNDYLKEVFSLSNRPNPFSGFTQIEVQSLISGEYDFKVTSLLGQEVHRERVQIVQGTNTIDFDGSQLPNGIYLYALTDGRASVSQKMIVQRR